MWLGFLSKLNDQIIPIFGVAGAGGQVSRFGPTAGIRDPGGRRCPGVSSPLASFLLLSFASVFVFVRKVLRAGSLGESVVLGTIG